LVDARFAGEHQHRELGVLAVQDLEHLHAVEARHVDVADDESDVARSFADGEGAHQAVGRFEHFVARVTQRLAEMDADGLGVVDNEDLFLLDHEDALVRYKMMSELRGSDGRAGGAGMLSGPSAMLDATTKMRATSPPSERKTSVRASMSMSTAAWGSGLG